MGVTRLYLVKIFLMMLFSSLSAHAYYTDGRSQISSTRKLLKKAKSYGIVISKEEKEIKKEISSLLKKSRRDFFKKVYNGLENSPNYQSYLYEIRDGRKNIENAKIIAAVTLYEKVRKNWAGLRRTIINDTGAITWKEFSPFLLMKLQNIVYISAPRVKNPEKLTFKVEQWGTVTVSMRNSRLQTVDWSIDVSTRSDRNTLAPGADKIEVADESKSSQGI